MKNSKLSIADKAMVMGAKAILAINVVGAIAVNEVEEKLKESKASYKKFKKSIAK